MKHLIKLGLISVVLATSASATAFADSLQDRINQCQARGGGACVFDLLRIMAARMDGEIEIPEADRPNGLSIITLPVVGSTLTSPTATFRWQTVPGATSYTLKVGKTPGGGEYRTATGLTYPAYTVGGLPNRGNSTIYVTLTANNGLGEQEATYTSM